MPKLPAPVDLDPLAQFIARLDMSPVLLEQHVADEFGRCRVCTRQQYAIAYPCSIRFRAEQAQQ